jgi:cytochrome c peroxidase
MICLLVLTAALSRRRGRFGQRRSYLERRAATPNKLGVPGLRGIRAAAPYFHNNGADTLEEVGDHYIGCEVGRAAAAHPVDKRQSGAFRDVRFTFLKEYRDKMLRCSL